MFDLGQSFIVSVERQPEVTAIVDGELRLSYARWHERILRLVGALDGMGLRPGDHLVTALQNRWEAATLHWACQLAGVVITPLNWRMTAGELDYCVKDAAAGAVVFENVSAGAVAGAPSAQAIPRVAVGGAGGGSVRFEALLDSAPAESRPRATVEDVSLMLYTSGTTGRPKGVPRRHHAERAAALAHVAQNLYAYGERTLGVMPLYHTMGVRSLLSVALVNGCFVCQPRFEPAQALGLLERERITTLYLVPTLYHDLLHHEAFQRTDISSVRKLGFAGAPMPEGLLHRVKDAFEPDLFVNHYGSSEVYTHTVTQDAAAKPGSAGKAGFNQRIRVVRLDGRDAEDLTAPGEEGQVIASLAGDEAFEGYWRRPDADEKALHEGWYYTGDTGYFDEDGDLFVTGRVDDIIITGGENVSPVEIENVLSLHPAVEEVAVAGLPDERWGERVTAFVKRGAEVDAETLDAHCRSSTLARFKRPRQYVFVRAIPKSPVGKILRRVLRAGDYETEEGRASPGEEKT